MRDSGTFQGCSRSAATQSTCREKRQNDALGVVQQYGGPSITEVRAPKSRGLRRGEQPLVLGRARRSIHMRELIVRPRLLYSGRLACGLVAIVAESSGVARPAAKRGCQYTGSRTKRASAAPVGSAWQYFDVQDPQGPAVDPPRGTITAREGVHDHRRAYSPVHEYEDGRRVVDAPHLGIPYPKAIAESRQDLTHWSTATPHRHSGGHEIGPDDYRRARRNETTAGAGTRSQLPLQREFDRQYRLSGGTKVLELRLPRTRTCQATSSHAPKQRV